MIPGSRPRHFTAQLGPAIFALLTGAMTVLWCTACQTRAETSKFEYRSDFGAAYDEGRILTYPWSNDLAFIKLSQAFADRECRSRALARLVVAPKEEDFLRSINAAIPEPSYPLIRHLAMTYPAMFGQDVNRLQSGEVICLGESATATIRTGLRVRSYQIKGSRDARQLFVGHLVATFQGLHIYGDSRAAASATIFARSEPLPSLNDVSALQRWLTRLTGFPITLIVRSDPFFWYADGPGFDPFQIPVPRVSGEEFLHRPYIYCGGASLICEQRVLQ